MVPDDPKPFGDGVYELAIVSDGEHCSRISLHRFNDCFPRGWIHMVGRFVEDEEFRLLSKEKRELEPSLLTTREDPQWTSNQINVDAVTSEIRATAMLRPLEGTLEHFQSGKSPVDTRQMILSHKLPLDTHAHSSGTVLRSKLSSN